MPSIPIGIHVVQKCPPPCCNRTLGYRVFILVLTFLCYMSYHLSRRPISVVKSVLHRNCSKLIPPPHVANNKTWCEWPPFDGENYHQLYGGLDYAYLFSYAISMFFCGQIAERMNLRHFLGFGMLLSGVFTAAFGMGYFFHFHSYGFYVGVQVLGGMFQATGWPSVVTGVANWFGKGKRGFIMGVWNSHTSVGNILGSIIPAIWVNDEWGWSFVVPGIIIFTLGVVVLLFFIPYPEDVGCIPPDHHKPVSTYNINDSTAAYSHASTSAENGGYTVAVNTDDYDYDPNTTEEDRLINNEIAPPLSPNPDLHQAISFRRALTIPGVIEFALVLFFAKLVSYTFLFWLPEYINESSKSHFDAQKAADLSALFDVGGIIGGILAGVISDLTGARASTCLVMLALAAPMMFLYEQFGNTSMTSFVALLMATGLLVNGPYALITTAVSADLGTHKSLQGNSKALATVTAIIDGTGSMGAALGPLVTGFISDSLGWNWVFRMLILADLLALVVSAYILISKEYPKLKAKYLSYQSRYQISAAVLRRGLIFISVTLLIIIGIYFARYYEQKQRVNKIVVLKS